MVAALSTPDPSPTNTKCTSFALFPALPVEIRRLIWEAAAPRIVSVEYRNTPTRKHHLRHVDTYVQYSDPISFAESNSPLPQLFYTCRESLEVRSRLYKRQFPTLGFPATTLFNFEIDTLLLGGYLFTYRSFLAMSYVSLEERAKVQNLALHASDNLFRDFHPGEAVLTLQEAYGRRICEVLRLFPNVGKLTIIFKNYTQTRVIRRAARAFPKSEIIFVNPVDLIRRRFMFSHPEYHVLHDGDELPPKEFWDFKGINGADFEATRVAWCLEHKEKLPNPILEHKISMTRAVKTEFDALQQAYESENSCRCYNMGKEREGYPAASHMDWS
ncbi:hypothetical protein G7Y89_g14090 [Cudoniella acicularis]|uniref:2EXR domain-containing protein n=1 Tax=Cudoniella acicularis TaxID=354080 RepID=A0A8H4R8G1_9HELO|nr:hypothetical protein G7Y89_g14090 [Cudoniella acicularis]